jgi:hypothetical protein
LGDTHTNKIPAPAEILYGAQVKKKITATWYKVVHLFVFVQPSASLASFEVD